MTPFRTLIQRNSPRKRRGFTILEVMIVAGIVAILAAIAYPSYQFWVISGRRADGTTALMDLANRMQRYYANNNTFASATIANVGAQSISPQGYYTLTLDPDPPPANSYGLLATRRGAQTADTRCGDLKLLSTNVRQIVGGTSGITAADCW